MDNRRCTAAAGRTLIRFALLALCVAGVAGWLAPVTRAAIPGDELWRRTVDVGGENDGASALAVGPGGTAVYVSGSVLRTGQIKGDLGVAKYTAAGSRKWLRTYDGAVHGNEAGEDVVCSRSGFVYVGGYGDRANGEDFLLIKYDKYGHRLWLRTWDGAAHGNDRIRALALDADGNIYAAGSSDGSGTSSDAALVKWTPAGGRAWVRRYDGAAHLFDEARDVVVDDRRDRVYIGGVSWSADAKSWLLIRYSLRGKRAWARLLGDPGTSADSSSLALSPGGSVYQAGSMGKTATADSEALLWKWTATGTCAWSRPYLGSGDDDYYDVAVDRRGNVCAAGLAYDIIGGHDRARIAAYTPGGALIGETNVGNTGTDLRWRAIACDGAGNVYAAGTWTSTTYAADYVVEKFSGTLQPVWQRIVRQADVDLDDGPADIAVRRGTNAGVYVTGRGAAATWDWFTLKFKP